MGFVLTLIFLVISLLSPAVLPEALQDIHILQIIAALLVVVSIPNLLSSGVGKLSTSFYVICVLVSGTISTMAGGWLGGAFETFLTFIPVIAMYYFVVINFTTLRRLQVLALVLAAVLSFIVLQGMLAIHSGDLTSPYVLREGFDLYRYRGLGVVNDPNDLAQVMVATIPLLFLRWKKGAYLGNIVLTILPACFLMVGVFLTHSRGGLMALIAATLYGLKDRLGIVRSVILTSVLCLALVLLNATGGRGMNEDDGGRVGLWGQALSAFREHPVFGLGINKFTEYSDNGLTAHNSYVLCLAEMGAIGYFCWMGAIVTSWTGLSARAKQDEEASASAARPVAGLMPKLLPTETEPVAPLTLGRSRFAHTTPTPAESGPSIEAIRYASHVVRAALAGTMVSAFFISRTYAMIFYIVFGVAGVLHVMRWKVEGQREKNEWKLRAISITMACSIVFLYLFIRLRGVS